MADTLKNSVFFLNFPSQVREAPLHTLVQLLKEQFIKMTMESIIKVEKIDNFDSSVRAAHYIGDKDLLTSASVESVIDTASSDSYKHYTDYSQTSLFPMMGLLLGHAAPQYYDKPLYDMSYAHGITEIKPDQLPSFNFAKISTLTCDTKTDSTYRSVYVAPINKDDQSLEAPQFTVIPEDDAKSMKQFCESPAQTISTVLSKTTGKVEKQRKRKSNYESDASEDSSCRQTKRQKTVKTENQRNCKKRKDLATNDDKPQPDGLTAALEMGVLLVKSCIDSIQAASADNDDEDDDDTTSICSGDSSSTSKKSTSSGKSKKRGKSEVCSKIGQVYFSRNILPIPTNVRSETLILIA